MQVLLGRALWRAIALGMLLTFALVSAPVYAQSTNIGNAANAVNSNHIADNAAGPVEIAANGVGSAQIAAAAVGSTQLADNAVGTAQIANDSIDLFSGKYVGGITGVDNRYVVRTGGVLAPNAIQNTCTTSGGLATSFFCNNASVVSLPFNGTGTFNATRVLEANAITADKFSPLSVGYPNANYSVHSIGSSR